MKEWKREIISEQEPTLTQPFERVFKETCPDTGEVRYKVTCEFIRVFEGPHDLTVCQVLSSD